MTLDVLDHDDGVVRDEPERSGDPRQRHEVDGLVGRTERQTHDGHGDRNRAARDERHAPAAQETEEDDHGHQHPDHDVVPRAVHRVGHEPCLVVECRPLHVAGQQFRSVLEQLAHALGDRDRIGRRLTDHVDENGCLAVGRRADVGDLVLDADLAQIGECRGRPVGDRYGDPGQRVLGVNAARHEREVELVVLLGQARGEHVVVRAHRVGDIGRGEPTALERGGVEPDLELASTSALHLDLGDAVDAQQGGLDRVLGEVPELRLGQAVGGERIPLDREDRRVHPLDRDVCVGWKVGFDTLGLSLDALERDLHVRAPRELGRHLGRAARRDGAHQDDARNAADRLFERPGDGGHHARRRLLPGVGDDLHDRECHRREDRRGQAHGGERSGHHEDEDEPKEGGGPSAERVEEAHG